MFVVEGQIRLRQAMPIIIVATVVGLGACSENKSGEAAGNAAGDTANVAAAPSSRDGALVGKAPTVPNSKSFVVLTPADPKELPAPASKPVMDQVQLSFVPALLIARSEYPVEFRSSDEELHNINIKHSRTQEQEFNIAIPPDGIYEHTFRNPGFYDVHCDIHPAMNAQIFVADTPHVLVAEPDGSFAFEGLPPGAYTLSVYVGGQRHDRAIQVASGRNEVRLTME
jgi:plastocyanin